MKKAIQLLLILFLLIIETSCQSSQNIYTENNKLFSRKNNLLNNIEKVELSHDILISNDLIGYSDNKLYFQAFNDIFQVIPYDLSAHTLLDPIYENTETVTISYSDYINGLVYIGETYFKEDDDIEFILKAIDDSGNVTVLMDEQVNKMPYINTNDEYILVNYSNIKKNTSTITTYLEAIHTTTFDHQFIDKRECKMINNELYNGEMIIYCGGFDNNLYYQIITLNNEMLETEGHMQIYSYSFEKGTAKEFASFDTKALYLTGNDQNMIISEYSFEDANKKTGKIYNMTKNSFQMIPDVEPAFDIVDCKTIRNNKIAFYNNFNYYVYDIEKSTYDYKTYNLTVNVLDRSIRYSTLKFSENSLGYIEYSTNKAYFYKINI